MLNLSDDELIAELKSLYSNELDVVAQSVVRLLEIQRREIDLERGYSSLYEFCAVELGYPKDTAYARIRACEVLQLAPEFLEHLKTGRVCMTSLKQAQVSFRRENHRRSKAKEPKLTDNEKLQVLNEIVETSARETDRILAQHFPKLRPNEEKVRALKDGNVLVQMIFTAEEYAEFERYKFKISHANPELSLAKTVLHAIRRPQPTPRKPNPSPPKEGRSHVPIHIKREIYAEADDRCTYVSSDGRRCTSRCFIETDHVKPLARGGTNDRENFRVLCDAHNRFCARKMGLHAPSPGPGLH